MGSNNFNAIELPPSRLNVWLLQQLLPVICSVQGATVEIGRSRGSLLAAEQVLSPSSSPDFLNYCAPLPRPASPLLLPLPRASADRFQLANECQEERPRLL